MNTTTVLFDLDGTLLPMDQDEFLKAYFTRLTARMFPRGYEPKKLIKTIMDGTAAMIKNDGSTSNMDVFWRVFAEVYGPESLADKPFVDDFYSKEFGLVKETCGFAPMAREIVDLLKSTGKTVVLATNPIFPAVATENRIRWAGLTPEEFALWTTYENSSFCKPNPAYYTEILNKIGAKPEECLMVGNDVGEDMIVRKLGMKVFLLTDCLINRGNEDITQFPHGSFPELKAFLETL